MLSEFEMKNKTVLGVAILLVVITGSLIGQELGFGQNQGAKRLTPEQVANVHSRIFQTEEIGAIPDRLAKGTGDIHLYDRGPVVQRVQLDPKDQLASWLRESDLIVLGKASTGTSHMTVGKGFLYTDWMFTIEKVLKDNPSASVKPETSIIVVRPGGKLKIGERTIYAIRTDYRDFKPATEYMLFLRFIPETGAYSVRWPIGVGFSGIRIVPIVNVLDKSEIEAFGMNKDALLQKVQEALTDAARIPPAI